jgi:spore coat protein A
MPDGVAFGHPHYTVTFEAAAHTFHEAIAPMAVYAYDGLYPGPSFMVRQFEPIVVEARLRRLRCFACCAAC